MDDFNTNFNNTAAMAAAQDRAMFIRKTYMHLAGAILVFIALEIALFTSGIAQAIAPLMMERWTWLLVIGGFMGISYLANNWATSDSSPTTQYIGLGLYIVGQAIITMPLLLIAAYYDGGIAVIAKAGVVSIALLIGITAVVFITRQDFSFLQPIVVIGGFIAMGAIVASIIFGFNLGTLFAFAMVAFAATAILLETSNVLHRFRTDQHVAASLVLFASVAQLFWWILRIFSSRD